MNTLYVFRVASIGLLLMLSFDVFGQTIWQKHAANPAVPYYAGGGYAIDPVVLFDSTTGMYRMWFTGKIYSGPWSIHYAISWDGITFYSYVKNPVLEGGSTSFEAEGVVYAGVVHDGTQYRMYYVGVAGGIGTAIGLATSPDGIHWTKYANNPVLRPSMSGWDAVAIGAAKVVYFDGTTFSLYYQGYDGTHAQIGLATSADGITWVKHPSNPVVAHGATGSWDENEVTATGLFIRGGVEYLFYSGYSQGWQRSAMGLATSANGITWTKYLSNPVLVGGTPATWDWTLHGGSAILRQDTVQMWYAGNSQGAAQWSIGYASSQFTPLGVSEPSYTLPLGFELKQNYPNPFNPTTTIEFSIPKASFVTLRIYDILGREIETLISDYLPAGVHHAQWNAGQFSSAGYFYRLVAGDFSQARQLVFQR